MRIASALTLIAAAAVSFSASAAPASTNVDTSVSTVAVSAHSGVSLSQADLDGVTGSYALQDGRTLRVTSEHRRLYAELGNKHTELVALSPNSFASRDDAVRLVFNSSDVPTEVKVSAIAK
jgi:hypothetical protein